MPLGPGKYDALATEVRDKAHAEAVLLIVFNGDKGSGFSCQTPPEMLAKLPAILRSTARQIEESSGHA